MDEFKILKKNLLKILILVLIIFLSYFIIYYQDKNTNFLVKLAENLIN